MNAPTVRENYFTVIIIQAARHFKDQFVHWKGWKHKAFFPRKNGEWEREQKRKKTAYTAVSNKILAEPRNTQ